LHLIQTLGLLISSIYWPAGQSDAHTFWSKSLYEFNKQLKHVSASLSQVAHPVPHTVQRLDGDFFWAKVPSGHCAKHWLLFLNRYVRY